jgi:hypothetical protein
MQRTGAGTKSGAFDFSTEYSLQMRKAVEKASQHPDMTPELAEVLSTPRSNAGSAEGGTAAWQTLISTHREIPSIPTIDVEYRVETG